MPLSSSRRRILAPAVILSVAMSGLVGCSDEGDSSASTSGDVTTAVATTGATSPQPSSATRTSGTTSSGATTPGLTTPGATGAATTGTIGTKGPDTTAAPGKPSPSATAEPAVAPAVSPTGALRMATSVLTRARKAEAATGKEGRDLRERSYAGAEAKAAAARARLRQGKPATVDPIVDGVNPNLLAISQGPDFPAYLIAQTQSGSSGLPQLHVLKTNDKGQLAKIVHSSTMLPGTSLAPFDPRGNGSPVGGSGVKGLNVSPRVLVESYAKNLGTGVTPDFKELAFRRDPFFSAVRGAAAKQESDIAAQARFSQRHRVVPDSIVTVKRADDWALVFAVVERVDTFDVKQGSYLEGPEAWLAFLPRETRISRRAELRTLEFLTFSVPKQGISGKAKLIAASEQLVGASGE